MSLKNKIYLIGAGILLWSAYIDYVMTLLFAVMFSMLAVVLITFIENNNVKELYHEYVNSDVDWGEIYATGFALFSFLVMFSVSVCTLIENIMNAVLLND